MQASARERAESAGETLHHFHGGLRLRHHKRISCELPLLRCPLPPRLYIPLLQHAGREAEPLVTVGQKVFKGEVIARFDTPTPGFVHASTSGTVTAIARQAISHPSGIDGQCVVVKPDGLDRWHSAEPIADWNTAEPATLCQRIQNSGIVGLGGAVFPTSKKVNEARSSGIHTLILNGAECEPYISCDEMLMRECPGKIINGARVLQRAVEAQKVIIAIEDQMGEVFEILQTAIDNQTRAGILLVKVTTIYPEGGEKQLIQVLTGLEVPAGGKPMDLGLLCVNVATAAAIADAVIEGKSLVERVVTVSGKGIRRPRNLLALVGTPIACLVDQCGGYTRDAARLVIGGPMMGYALASDQNPVVKAANCVLALNEEDIRPAQKEMPCIRCGECARVCPAQLMPQTLNWQIRNELYDQAADFGLDECIECGCCDFVCPSHIPLVEWFRFGKSELRTLAIERTQARLAKQRFEARETRLERLKRERSKRMEEKKQALRDEAGKKLNIAAALSRVKAREQAAKAEKPAKRLEDKGEAGEP